MMKKVVTYMLFFCLLVFLTFLYGFTAKRNGNKKVKKTVVEFEAGDNNFLTHSIVDKLLIQNKEFVKNQPKRVVDLHLLENQVLANSYVEKTTVFLTVDGVLKTIIKQRKPIARIIESNNAYYIDKLGKEIPLSTNFSARVPLVTGIKSDEEIKKLIGLIETIEKNDFLVKEIIAIKKNNQNEYEFTVRSGNYKIIFGKLINVNEKFKKLLAFYNKALTDKTIKKYKAINVKYHNQVVCTKNNQDGEQ